MAPCGVRIPKTMHVAKQGLTPRHGATVKVAFGSPGITVQKWLVITKSNPKKHVTRCPPPPRRFLAYGGRLFSPAGHRAGSPSELTMAASFLPASRAKASTRGWEGVRGRGGEGEGRRRGGGWSGGKRPGPTRKWGDQPQVLLGKGQLSTASSLASGFAKSPEARDKAAAWRSFVFGPPEMCGPQILSLAGWPTLRNPLGRQQTCTSSCRFLCISRI